MALLAEGVAAGVALGRADDGLAEVPGELHAPGVHDIVLELLDVRLPRRPRHARQETGEQPQHPPLHRQRGIGHWAVAARGQEALHAPLEVVDGDLLRLRGLEELLQAAQLALEGRQATRPPPLAGRLLCERGPQVPEELPLRLREGPLDPRLRRVLLLQGCTLV